MSEDLLNKIPQWLKPLYEMENALRNAARNGVILQKDKVSEHLAEARRHLEDVVQGGTAAAPSAPIVPAPKDGEV